MVESPKSPLESGSDGGGTGMSKEEARVGGSYRVFSMSRAERLEWRFSPSTPVPGAVDCPGRWIELKTA